jgi:hypothetical protein
MSNLRRHRLPGSQTARAAGPQSVSATVQAMRWQGPNKRGRQLRRPYSLALIGLLVSVIPAQRGQANTCRIACSEATRADRDHTISMLQDWQIGADSFAIERLSISMAPVPDWERCRVKRQKGPLLKSKGSGSTNSQGEQTEKTRT